MPTAQPMPNNQPKPTPKTNTITFNLTENGTPKEIMRLDEQGMVYKGQRIEDAGEAHRAFLEVMAIMKERAKQ